MTPEQRFIFDVQGYIVLKGVLGPEQVRLMQADMDAHGISAADNDPAKSRFSDFLRWGPVWRDLIDQPALLPVLGELLGPKYRLDHAYGMAMNAHAKPGGEGLHHEAGMFHHGCYYMTHNQTMHNGLIVVSYALCDVEPGYGGFCCIPGSHKAQFPVPKAWYGVLDNPMLRHVPMQAGDVVVFTEALTHGTMPWTHKGHERRAVLLKYCPHYMQWANGPMPTQGIEGLTERQQLIMERPWVWQRPTVG